jgi:hypothetical protein
MLGSGMRGDVGARVGMVGGADPSGVAAAELAAVGAAVGPASLDSGALPGRRQATDTTPSVTTRKPRTSREELSVITS